MKNVCKTVCPNNQKLFITNCKCGCTNGQRLNLDGECAPCRRRCPRNSSLHPRRCKCVCNKGYTRVKRRCVKVDVDHVKNGGY